MHYCCRPVWTRSMNYSAEGLARRELERQLIADGTAIWRTKREVDQRIESEDRKQLREMLATYHPWGKPGNGAPIPGHLKKTKLILEACEPPVEHVPSSVMTLGRPGHGAPLRTSSGKAKTLLKADPSIRFQFHEPSRRSVDNDLRYRASPGDKENYRKALDAIVYEKNRSRSEEPGLATRAERKKAAPYQRDKMIPWGRPGPGGRAWRDPGTLGHNFLKSMGWTNDVMLKRLESRLPHCHNADHQEEQMYEISGGVELVPLLAKHRMTQRCPLATTDVTRMSKVPNGPPKTAMPEKVYHGELSSQVNQRQQMIQEARREELESSQRHFETWKGFWGRPGHGAPKGVTVGREKLEVILYHVPAQPGLQMMR